MARSLRARINAFCRQCIYDARSGLGTWRAQTGACEATDCPLWDVRPLPDKRDRKGVPGGRKACRAEHSGA